MIATCHLNRDLPAPRNAWVASAVAAAPIVTAIQRPAILTRIRFSAPRVMNPIEEDYVAVRVRYLQIMEARDVAIGVLRRANLRTMFSRESFSPEGWRRLFFASSRETHVRQRIEAVKEQLRSGPQPMQAVLPFLLLERRNWPIITGRTLLEYRPDVSFEQLRKIHDIWSGQQAYIFSPKVFWKVVFPLFALITGSQAHLFGSMSIPDRVLEHRYFHLAIIGVLGYSMVYFLSHVILVSRARRDDEAMGWALTSAEVLQEGAGFARPNERRRAWSGDDVST